MMEQDELLKILGDRYSTNPKDDHITNTSSFTKGIVVDTDDPLQMGRLRVFCPSYGDNPSKIHLLPWCVYVSPFGGTIDNTSYERNGETSEGSIAYGMWAIPDLGADVAVGCFDGDLRRRFWAGCLYKQQETHTILNGRYEWSNGSVNGPLTSNGNPIQPMYDNAKKAFDNKTNSPEFQSRIADYSVTAVDKSKSQTPNSSNNIHLDQQQDEISSNQPFDFNKEIVGSNGYDYSGFTHIPIKASRVYGFGSPGFHALSMDDRPFNNRTKWRSSSGHMILLDDTNGRVYITTNKGNNYIEMDENGNIDMFSERRISIHSAKDINLDADGSIRMTAREGIYGYAGSDSGLEKLSSNPTSGEIRLQSQHDMHIISDNYRQLSFADTIFEIGGKRCESVGGDYFLQVQNDINIITNDGDYNITVSGDYNLNVLHSLRQFSIDGASLSTKGDVNVYSYYGNMNLAAQQNIVQKSVSGNISLEAVGGNSSGAGSVSMKSPSSQMSVSKSGTSISTTGSMSMQSGGDMSVQSNSPPSQAQPIPEDKVPDVSCDITGPLTLIGYTGVDLAARAAFNAGFRGKPLIVATAIAGAESRWNPNATGDVGLQTSKWGPSVGFWQVRTLKVPTDYSYPDTLRDITTLYDPQENAIAAYAFSKQGQNFGPWTTYMNQSYLAADNMQPAIDAVNRLCSGLSTPTPTPSIGILGDNYLSVENISSSDLPLFGASPLKPSIKITEDGIILQALADITFVSLNSGESINAFSSVKNTIDLTVDKVNQLITVVDSCCSSGLTPLAPMADVGITIPIEQIPSTYFPYASADSESILNLANFDINGGTIIV